MVLPDVGELGFVNHVPTLLRNNRTVKTVSGVQCGDDVFVDSRHKTLSIPVNIIKVLNVIFGTDPERCYFNYRMFMVLQLLYSTEFAQLLDDKFPNRIFDLESAKLIEDQLGSVSVEKKLEDPDIAEVAVIGRPEADHSRGRLALGWIVETKDSTWGVPWGTPWGGFTIVFVTNLDDGTTAVVEDVDGLFPLPGASFGGRQIFIRFSTGPDVIPTGFYTITSLAEPTEDFSALLGRILDLGVDVLEDIFTGPDEIQTGKALFNTASTIELRLTGLFLALTFRLEGLRAQGAFLAEAA